MGSCAQAKMDAVGDINGAEEKFDAYERILDEAR
jgi:hypothetical protein